MFWACEKVVSSIDDKIDQGLTLGEVLDDDSLLSECKLSNEKLIRFLTTTENITELLNFFLCPPDEDGNFHKYAALAGELLISGIDEMFDALVGICHYSNNNNNNNMNHNHNFNTSTTTTTEDDIFSDNSVEEIIVSNNQYRHLDRLFGFLHIIHTVHFRQAAGYCKLICTLISLRPIKIFNYLQSRKYYLAFLLEHLEQSIVQDILLSFFIGLDDFSAMTEIYQWFDKEDFIYNLLDLIQPQHSEETILNASNCLCEIVQCLRKIVDKYENQYTISRPNVSFTLLLDSLESEVAISCMLDHIISQGSNKTVVESACAYLLMLMNHAKITQPLVMKPTPCRLINRRITLVKCAIIKAFLPRAHDFYKILSTTPLVNPELPTQYRKPLGPQRIAMLKFLEILITTTTTVINYGKLLISLKKNDVFTLLFDLMQNYPYNSFLHQSFESIIVSILSNSSSLFNTSSSAVDENVDDNENDSDEENLTESITNTPNKLPQQSNHILHHLFLESNFIQRLLKLLNFNRLDLDAPRMGYMGHLHNICHFLHANLCKGPNSQILFTIVTTELPPEVLEELKEYFIHDLFLSVDKWNYSQIEYKLSTRLRQQTQGRMENMCNSYIVEQIFSQYKGGSSSRFRSRLNNDENEERYNDDNDDEEVENGDAHLDNLDEGDEEDENAEGIRRRGGGEIHLLDNDGRYSNYIFQPKRRRLTRRSPFNVEGYELRLDLSDDDDAGAGGDGDNYSTTAGGGSGKSSFQPPPWIYNAQEDSEESENDEDDDGEEDENDAGIRDVKDNVIVFTQVNAYQEEEAEEEEDNEEVENCEESPIPEDEEEFVNNELVLTTSEEYDDVDDDDFESRPVYNISPVQHRQIAPPPPEEHIVVKINEDEENLLSLFGKSPLKTRVVVNSILQSKTEFDYNECHDENDHDNPPSPTM